MGPLLTALWRLLLSPLGDLRASGCESRVGGARRLGPGRGSRLGPAGTGAPLPPRHGWAVQLLRGRFPSGGWGRPVSQPREGARGNARKYLARTARGNGALGVFTSWSRPPPPAALDILEVRQKPILMT